MLPSPPSLEVSLLTELSLQLLRLRGMRLELRQHLRHHTWLGHPQLLLLARPGRHQVEDFLLAAGHHRGGGQQAGAGAAQTANTRLGLAHLLLGAGRAGRGAGGGGGLAPALLSGSHLARRTSVN